MDKFKASFRFYEKAAPYPGFCLRCGTSDKLWHLGEIRGTNMAAYYCDHCLTELAGFSGMVFKHIHEQEVSALQEKVTNLETQVAAAPELLKELSANVNNILSDFVTNLATVATHGLSNGAKSSKANTGGAKGKSGSAAEAGQGKGQGSEPSSEPASE